MNPSHSEPTAPSTTPPIPWLKLMAWFIGTRAIIWGFAGLAVRYFPKADGYPEPRGPLDWLMHWDAQWFLGVASSGYSYDPNQMSSVNFLPVYPMSVRAVAWLLHDFDLSSYVVSHAYCFGAMVLLWRLCCDVSKRPAVADAAIVFFLLGPVALFFASIYSESTFLFFVLGTILLARRGHWLAAGLCGATAALSRSVGLLLILPLVVEYWQQHASLVTWRKLRTWLGLACCGLPALGTASYVVFLWWRFGDPHAYSNSQHHGGHTYCFPWELFTNGFLHAMNGFYQWWFGGAAVVGMLLVVAGGLLRVPASFNVFAFATCLLYFSVTSLEGVPRFLSIVFPFYYTLGLIAVRWPWAGRVLLGLSMTLLALSTSLFVSAYWFT